MVLFTFLLVLVPLPVDASATLIQENNNGISITSSSAVVTVTLSSVTSGNVLVVGLEIGELSSIASPVTDSLGSVFTPAVTTITPSGPNVAIWEATLSSSGADTVRVAQICPSCGPGSFVLEFDVFVYEVAGVTAMGLATGTGIDTLGHGPIFTSSVSFQPGAFLFGMISGQGEIGAGAGFTLSTEKSILGVSNGQWSDPVSSPTTFPAHLFSPAPDCVPCWVEAGVALNPAPTPPIPEYPLGLPILAILTILAYGVIRRKTVTK